MAGIIETPKIDRNTNIPEDFCTVIYGITNVLKNLGIDLKQLKKHINRIENLESSLMICLNIHRYKYTTRTRNIQP